MPGAPGNIGTGPRPAPPGIVIAPDPGAPTPTAVAPTTPAAAAPERTGCLITAAQALLMIWTPRPPTGIREIRRPASPPTPGSILAPIPAIVRPARPRKPNTPGSPW